MFAKGAWSACRWPSSNICQDVLRRTRIALLACHCEVLWNMTLGSNMSKAPQGHVPQDLTMTSKQCNPCTSQYILADIWAGPPASAPSALCEHGPFHLPRTCCTSQAPRSLHFSAGSVFACLIRSTLMYFASGWRNAKPLRKICKNETVQSCSIHSFLTTGFWSILIYLVLLTCFDKIDQNRPKTSGPKWVNRTWLNCFILADFLGGFELRQPDAKYIKVLLITQAKTRAALKSSERGAWLVQHVLGRWKGTMFAKGVWSACRWPSSNICQDACKNNNFTTSTSYNTKSPVEHRRNPEIYRNNERSGCFQIINNKNSETWLIGDF